MSSPTVWVVDDDRSIRWVLEKALQGAGLQHAVFDSAKAARKALEAETPTVVITTTAAMCAATAVSSLTH